MKLYHGTQTNRAKKILADKEICATSSTNTQYPLEGHAKTTYGYVYLSKNINEALGFGLLASPSKLDRQFITIFEIEVEDEEIEIDEDEERHNALVTTVSLPPDSCVRIKRNLVGNKDIKRYVCLAFKNYDHGCKFADDPDLENKISDRWTLL